MGIRGGDTAMKSSNTLRGQMGLRSGPLAPTSAKLTTQYLVLDHMNNHYSKITKAKPAIDNKPPKSISTSQKARDRKLRDHVQKTGQRPLSASRGMSRPHTTTGYYQDDIFDETQWGEVDPNDEEEMLIHSIMRTTLRSNADPTSTHATLGSDPQQQQDGFAQYTRVPRQRPGSARSLRSMGSAVSRTMVQVPSKKGTYDGDLLEKRSHVFTEEKPFTPRTLKTDRKSRLSQYKYYNKLPPKEKTKQQEQPSGSMEKKQDEGSTESRPQPKPRQPRLDQTREGPVTMNSLMFETLHSRDFSKFEENGQNADVPKLDISMDTDHLKWIKEQASKAKVRANNETLKSTVREEDPYDTSVDFGKTGEMSLTYGTLGSTKTRPPLGSSKKKLSAEDEEAMYVRFMRDVTNEVLDRGIYTDRSLRQVFKSHIAQNRGKLDELRMHEITDNIRKELNIPRYDIDDDTSLTMTKDSEYVNYNATDSSLDKYMSPDYKPSRVRGHDTMDTEAGMNGTLETSLKSRASKMSGEQSADSYPFKSAEDDDLYSTIRSDMNNSANLTDTQALKTYQMSINEQEELEEGEVVEAEEEGEVHETADRGEVTPRAEKGEVNPKAEEKVNVREATTGNTSARATEDEDDDDEEVYEDDYTDDGDDEEEEDGHHTTEPTATYRTDDDDF